MTYFTLCVQDFKDGKEQKKSLYTYETETEAIARFHSFIGGYMGGDNIASIISVVIDGKGAMLQSEYWETTETSTTDTTTETTTDTTTE